MDKFSFITLWDTYNGVLTPTQLEITDMYFNLDLTVSEIADEKGISRQAVSECMKTCKKQLEEFETKLHICERIQNICLELSFMTTDAVRWAENFKSAHPELSGDADRLLEIIRKDYSEEVRKQRENPETAEILNGDYTEKEYDRKKTGED